MSDFIVGALLCAAYLGLILLFIVLVPVCPHLMGCQ